MQIPTNTFKQRLLRGDTQIGLWLGLADAYAAELLAGTGFDWLAIDAEHAPNDLRTVLAQLQAVAPYPVQPVVRPVEGDVALIKQYLDAGAQTLLIPMVDSAEQAAQMVQAMRYPPKGIRGVGSALARSSRWNGIADYLTRADDEMCLLAQVESAQGLKHLDAIARTEGVDGVFFGPADLSASLGYLGRPGAPEVQQVICESITKVRKAGKAAGVLSADPVLARRYLEQGATFVAVGVDTTLLAQAARQLAAAFKSGGAAPVSSSGSVY